MKLKKNTAGPILLLLAGSIIACIGLYFIITDLTGDHSLPVRYYQDNSKTQTGILILLIGLPVCIFSLRRLFTQSKRTGADFYSINKGNQNKIIFAPAYNKQWFDELNKKYSRGNFELYDNRLWQYMYHLSDTLPALAKEEGISEDNFFSGLTRGQKVFYSFLVFNGDTDNGGIYQFFFNRPAYCMAALETFKELGLNKLAEDYEVCLAELFNAPGSFWKRKLSFNNLNISEPERLTNFMEGYSDMRSAEKIEAYYYKEDFKKQLYKTMADYIDDHLEQFVKM